MKKITFYIFYMMFWFCASGISWAVTCLLGAFNLPEFNKMMGVSTKITFLGLVIGFFLAAISNATIENLYKWLGSPRAEK